MKESIKPVALDGRLYQKPQIEQKADDKKAFSLFWTIQRTTQKSDANLVIQYVPVEHNMKISFPSKRTFSDMSAGDDFKLPILINPKKIAKHTKLLAMDDVDLHKHIKASHTGSS